MKYVVLLIVTIFALISTLLVAGKSDKNYNKAAKNNVTLLTLIYIVAILGSLIALTIYISL